jgi:type I restriction enzyme M protein
VEYEVNEDEEKTKKIIIDYLKNEIKDLKQSTHPSAKKEREAYEKELKNITDLENELKGLNKELGEKEKELRLKIKVKKYGIDEEIQEYPPLLQKAKEQLESIKDKTDKESKSQKTALNKDIKILEYKITHAKKFLEDMGGIITTEEAKELILEKLYNQINTELERYLNSEKRAMIANYENLFDKYFVSLESLKHSQEESLTTLNEYLKELGYIHG